MTTRLRSGRTSQFVILGSGVTAAGGWAAAVLPEAVQGTSLAQVVGGQDEQAFQSFRPELFGPCYAAVEAFA